MAGNEQLNEDFRKGRISFADYVHGIHSTSSPSRATSRYKVMDTVNAEKLGVEVFGEYVKVGWSILPNPFDKDMLQRLLDRNIISLR